MIAIPLPFPEFAPSPEPTPSVREQPHTEQRPAPTPLSSARSERRRRAIWLGIHLLDWPLRAALSSMTPDEQAALNSQPLAVVECDRRNSVAACNAAALSVGIRPGHSLNASIALCANTQFLPRHIEREGQLLDEIANLCQKYTSSVCALPPNELLLEVRGSVRLFGGITALIALVRDDLQRRGLNSQIALSATAQSAQWLARITKEPAVVTPRFLLSTLSRLPIQTLMWPIDIELRLRRFGVTTVGDLLRLPRGGLARRIGYDRLRELDQAVGRHPEIRRHFKPVERYEDRVILDFEIETTQLLGVVIERRLERLQRFLTRRNIALDRLHIELKHRDQPHTQFPIGLANPTSDMAHVSTLVKEHLGRLQLPAPVNTLSLQVAQLLSANGSTTDLFLSKAGEFDPKVAQSRLLEKLQARLGVDAVRRLVVREDHRPERAHTTANASIEAMTPMETLPAIARPLWLLSSAKQIRLMSMHRCTSVTGPEKIEAGWWDETLVDRDYFRMLAPSGSLGWIYRDNQQPMQWYLHGLFG